MTFKFLAQIPDTPGGQSPTVWLDEETGDIIAQGYKVTEEDYVQADAAGSTPGHRHDAASIPNHEAMVRLPASMLPALKAALSA